MLDGDVPIEDGLEQPEEIEDDDSDIPPGQRSPRPETRIELDSDGFPKMFMPESPAPKAPTSM
eukprot:1716293-Alexandrium_andersonii.AAC.1